MRKLAFIFFILIFVSSCGQKPKQNYTITYSNPPSPTAPMKPPAQQQVDIIYPTPTHDVVVENVTVQTVPSSTPVVSETYTLPEQPQQVYNITDIDIGGGRVGTRNNLGFQISVMQNPAGYWWNVTWSCMGDTSGYTQVVVVDKMTNNIVGVGEIVPRGARQGGFNFPISLAQNPSNMKVIIR